MFQGQPDEDYEDQISHTPFDQLQFSRPAESSEALNPPLGRKMIVAWFCYQHHCSKFRLLKYGHPLTTFQILLEQYN